jgi:hypothetical protein
MPPKWSRLNKVAVLFEYEVDAEGCGFSEENLPSPSARVVVIGEKMFALFYECSSNSR